MEYKVIEMTSPDEREEFVSAMRQDNWIPCGGVAVNHWHVTWKNERKGYTESETFSVYAQAMTRTQEDR